MIYVYFYYSTWYEDEYYSSVFIPLRVRPTTLCVYQWTDSLAPIVPGANQKFYVYAYYGLCTTASVTEFPRKTAFTFPADMSNLIITYNTSVKNEKKEKSNVLIKGPSNVPDNTGFYSFTVMSTSSDSYMFNVKDNSSTSSIKSYFIDYAKLNTLSVGTPIYPTPPGEIYMTPQSRIVGVT